MQPRLTTVQLQGKATTPECFTKQSVLFSRQINKHVEAGVTKKSCILELRETSKIKIETENEKERVSQGEKRRECTVLLTW